jgi:L,D-transpeptidase ErfK/SrfK
MTKAIFFSLMGIFYSLLLFIPPAVFPFETTFFISRNNEVFGETKEVVIKSDKGKMTDLALKYDVGYNVITAANPGIDPWYPGKGKKIIIPTSWVLPDIPDSYWNREKKGFILINLAEFRLFLVERTGNFYSVITYPIGIGKQGFETPLGQYKIVEKMISPPWIIPLSFRNEYPDLPDIVPPGPENPLGKYVLRLSSPGLLIHEGSPLSLGRKVSHGCMRLSPEDMKELFSMTYPGYDVIIQYQPIKVGVKDGIPYIEIHRDYLHGGDLLLEAVRRLDRQNLLGRVNPDILYTAVTAVKGYPVRLVTP